MEEERDRWRARPRNAVKQTAQNNKIHLTMDTTKDAPKAAVSRTIATRSHRNPRAVRSNAGSANVPLGRITSQKKPGLASRLFRFTPSVP